MLTIYLARHGQDTDNAKGILNGHRDTQLTTRGIKQAKRVAVEIVMAKLQFVAVYSSPLNRAYSTARGILSFLPPTYFEILPELIERDFGILTGRPVADIEALCAPDILKTDTVTYALAPANGESCEEAYQRAVGILERLQKKHASGNILLVTHGDLGKMLFAAYYKLPWMDVLSLFHFGNSELVKLSPDTTPENAKVFSTSQHNV